MPNGQQIHHHDMGKKIDCDTHPSHRISRNWEVENEKNPYGGPKKFYNDVQHSKNSEHPYEDQADAEGRLLASDVQGGKVRQSP